MAMVTIILTDDETRKCGFKVAAFTGETVDQDNPSKSHTLASHTMNWLKEVELEATKPEESADEGEE